MSLEEAVTERRAADTDKPIPYTHLAEKHGVVRSTLTRREQGLSVSREQKAIAQRLLTPTQEGELVEYIEGLTERHLPPTRTMIKNFASEIAGKEPSDSWVTDFLHRNRDHLISQWATAMDSDRHTADSWEKYKQYFDLMHRKMQQYLIQPENTYNMDEKGFAIGKISKSKRVFSKPLYKQKHSRQASQDGNRKWITLLSCICGDGSWLPPGLIYAAETQNIQSSWVDDLDKDTHSVFTAVSPSGWTNDDAALSWLEQIFNRFTKRKCRRRYRLLIVDGHGSHLTMRFVKFCDLNKIMIAVYPPHSTHTLQPLDVVCFSPLAGNYSKALTKHLHNAQGLVPIKKGDFFRLFWQAWVETFTEKLILSAFKHTGLIPYDPNVILNKFATDKDEPRTPEPVRRVYDGKDWRTVNRHLQACVKDKYSSDAVIVRETLHHLSIQNQLLQMENLRLQEALNQQKKGNKRGRALPLIQRQSWDGETQWWSPSRVDEAQRLLDEADETEKAEEIRKSNVAELRETNRKLKQKLDAEKAEKREREKKERDERRAEERRQIDARKAERARKKEEKDREKASQTAQKGKRKLPQQQGVKKKQNRGDAAARSSVVPHEPPSAPPPTLNSRGRKILQPRKFW